MSVTRFQSITSIVRKDFKLFSRDFLFLFLTVLGVVTFVVLYWVIPDNVDESITMGVRGPDILAAMSEFAEAEEEGIDLAVYSTTGELRQAVEEKEIEIGIDFTDSFLAKAAAGEKANVQVFVRPSLPPEISGAMVTMVKEIAYAVAGQPLPVTEPDEQAVVLGEDRAGNPIPFRDRLRPLYAFMILIMEAIALAALIGSEVQQKTLTALLSTPARVGDILLAKMTVGTTVAFSEAALITLVIRGFGSSPGIVLVALFFGSVMVSGIALIAGSAGKDLMGSMLLGLIVLIPLAIPGFAVLFPGEPAGWVRVLPSYGIVQAIVSSSIDGAGWSESARHIAILAGWCVASAAAGVLILKRRVTTL